MEINAYNGWITDRKPEDGEKVLISISNSSIEIGRYASEINQWLDDDCYCYSDETVLAWQPLPEPYKKPETPTFAKDVKYNTTNDGYTFAMKPFPNFNE